MNSRRQSAYLIVNADDYGYFDCVSRGILRSVRQGIVTATGVLANSAYFEKHVPWLSDYQDLDLGVHLNLTDRKPLTVAMGNKLARWAGQFPDKYTVAKAVLTGAISSEEIMSEWRAQIERFLDRGLEIRFLKAMSALSVGSAGPFL